MAIFGLNPRGREQAVPFVSPCPRKEKKMSMNHEHVNGESLNILLVEDNEGHAELIFRSFQNHRVANRIYHVLDGEAALDYLLRRAEYADPETSPRPHVILLDLRLPKIDGLEVLKEIKTVEIRRNEKDPSDCGRCRQWLRKCPIPLSR